MSDWDKYYYYDETSPSCLRWLYGNGYKMKPADVAGGIGHGGYYVVELFDKATRVHTVIYEMLSGYTLAEGELVDHADGVNTNNSYLNLRLTTYAGNSRNTKMHKSNKSGKCGVCLDEKNPGKFYWVASWRNLDKKQVHKSFSLAKYGHDEAFRLACEHRAKMIEELNAQGAGYTERHGT